MVNWVGTSGNNNYPGVNFVTIASLSGADSLDGGAGNDTVVGYGGNDTVLGGAGNDFLQGDGLALNPGSDSIDGGAGTDTIFGNSGNDTLLGGSEGDLVWGGLGNDRADGGDGGDSIYGDLGSESIAGGGGADYIEADGAFGGILDDLLSIVSGGADTADGGEGDDTIRGGGGNDIITGGAGDDELHGGAGDDSFAFGFSFTASVFEAADFSSWARPSLNANLNAWNNAYAQWTASLAGDARLDFGTDGTTSVDVNWQGKSRGYTQQFVADWTARLVTEEATLVGDDGHDVIRDWGAGNDALKLAGLAGISQDDFAWLFDVSSADGATTLSWDDGSITIEGMDLADETAFYKAAVAGSWFA